MRRNTKVRRQKFTFLKNNEIVQKHSNTNIHAKHKIMDHLYKWRLNLNNNTLYILSLELQTKDFYMNVRLRMYKYCYSNLGPIYAKVQYTHRVQSEDQTKKISKEFKQSLLV